jgi:cob(I)alamin adenosyltransferase
MQALPLVASGAADALGLTDAELALACASHGGEPDHAATAAQGWAEIARRIGEQRHDFYVLDEFTYPLKWGWVDVQDVVEALAARPGRQHVVITGRDAPQPLLDAADLVTEMTKVKHPMDAGRKGQRGIEW